MKISTTLILSCVLIGALAVGDAFSRGMGGGGMRGGGASFGGGGAASRSPSMGNMSTSQRSTPTRSASSARQAKPSGGKAQARPAQPSQKPSSAKTAARPTKPTQKTAAKPTKPAQKPAARPSQPAKGRPTQQDVKNFLDTPSKGGRGPSASDLAKIGGGAAAGALGVEAARKLLAEKPAGPGQRPIKPEQPVAGKPGAPGKPGKPGQPATRPERPVRPGQPIAKAPGTPGSPQRPGQPGGPGMKPKPEHPIAKPPHHPGGPPPRPVQPIARPPYNKIPPNWWKWAGWGAAAGWIAGAHFSRPYYYGYGDNVYYENDYVYIDGQQAATGEEYYSQARTIATSAPAVEEPATKKANQEDWLPLGVFGLYQGDAKDSNMVLQLAMNKKGVISGTYYNVATNTERPVSGMVDQKTQRAAWTFADGKNTDVIMETGLANLTENQGPALVHFGKNKTEQWLMVRQPESKQGT